MHRLKQQESNTLNDAQIFKSHHQNLFNNGGIISIREALRKNQSQPQYNHHQISSNINLAVQKYSGPNRDIDELKQYVIQLEEENKMKAIEIQRLISEKEMLLKSALSANQKLKHSRRVEQNIGREDLYNQKTESSYIASQSLYLRPQTKQRYPSLNNLSALQDQQNNTTIEVDKTQPNDAQLLLQRIAKLELQIQQMSEKIIAKDQGIIELLNRLKTYDQSFSKNELKKFISLIEKQIGQLDKATFNEDQIISTQNRYINIFKDNTEILGFTLSDQPIASSALVISQQLEGQIKTIDIVSADGKCLQVTVDSCTVDSQDNKDHRIRYPVEPLESSEKRLNFHFPPEVVYEKQKFLQEIWFHELVEKKVLLAEISVKSVVLIDEIKLENISSRIEILNQANSQLIETPIFFRDKFSNSIKQTLCIHEIIIYTNHKHIYGLQAIYWDGKNFHQGNIMKGDSSKDQDEAEGVIALNKAPKERYSKSRQLQTIQYFKNQSTFLIEKMVLGYKTQSIKQYRLDSSNSTTTNLNCEIGVIHSKYVYDTIKIDIKQGMIIEAQFIQKKDCPHTSQIVITDINLV